MSGLFELTGQRAVVTGASQGIGAAIATALMEVGADVVTLQRRPHPAALDEVARGLGRRLGHVPVDLADERAIDAAARAVLGEGDVDILVTNGGTQSRHDAVEFPLPDFDRVLAVNPRATFQLCQVFGRPMVSRGHGKIVTIASLLSFQGGLRVPAYAAAKGAVAQLTKALCNEWASRGVNVNAIAPGYVATEMNTALLADEDRHRQISERIPAGRWASPEDIAGAAVFLASSAADYVHGVVLPVDGGWLAR